MNALPRARAAVDIARTAFANAWRDGIGRLAAGLAFYGLFSLLPLAMVAISLAGAALGESAARVELLHRIEALSGPELAGWVDRGLLQATAPTGRGWRTAVSLLCLVYAAASSFRALGDALNSIWNVTRRRSWLPRIALDSLVSFGVVCLCGAALTASAISSVLLAAMPRWLARDVLERLHLLSRIDLIATWVIVGLLLATIYKTLPARHVSWQSALAGAGLAATLLVLSKWAVGLYVARSVVYSIFGTASSLFALLVWTYAAALIVLFGAELSCAADRRSGALDRREGQSTGGAPAPRPSPDRREETPR